MLTSRSASPRSDLETALAEPAGEGEPAFSASERAILENVLKLGDMRVEDVMVPRADIEAVEASVSVGQVVAQFREVGHSRLPVYEDNLDKVIGMIHIKDVLDCITESPGAAANGAGNGAANGSSPAVKLASPRLRQKLSRVDLVREVLFVPPSMPVTDLLQSMQASRIHMAVVVDEYGGTDGLATIEDLLEAVVGNIEDEHDEDDVAMLRRIDEDTFLVNARIELTDLQEAMGEDLGAGEYAEEVDTLGGLVFTLAGRVPLRGEIVARLDDWEFEIIRADRRRVRQVRVMRKRRAAPPRARIEALPPPEAFAAAETKVRPEDLRSQPDTAEPAERRSRAAQ